jgi:predicted SnoaL-like aldol condensation-catalyzing enzyme
MKSVYASLLICLAVLSASGCQETKGENNMNSSNKQKVVDLLKSIETGNPAPVSYVNSQKYIQHNLAVADGLEGFGALLKQLPPKSARVNTVRVFQDGDFVFAHTEYNFFGPKIGFDIFRFENGKIVEHWDNLQETVIKTKSGRSMIDGPAEVADSGKTVENKKLIEQFLDDVLYGKNPGKITDYVSTEKYHQHNPGVADGLDGLGKAIEELNKAGMPMKYAKTYRVLGEGNFVLTVSEGEFMKKHVAFYDLFRIENKKIVEHWDVIETILSRDQWKNSNGKF